MKQCLCGCGIGISDSKNYVRGHSRKGVKCTVETRNKMKENHANFKGEKNPRYKIENHIRILCLCGCGILASENHNYVNGHNNRGKHISEEQIHILDLNQFLKERDDK